LIIFSKKEKREKGFLFIISHQKTVTSDYPIIWKLKMENKKDV